MAASKKALVISLSIGTVVVAAAAWFLYQSSQKKDGASGAYPLAETREQQTPGGRAVSSKTGNGLTMNKAVKKRIEKKNASESPFRFDVEYIFSALSAVRTDADGNVIVDGQTLELLEATFSKLTEDIEDAELEELQALIQLGLPGDAGKDAAKIIGDYYHYRSAEKDFLDSAEGLDVDGISQNFEQLVALREAHLGYDVAEKLYGEEQRANRFMIDAMKIQEDPSLSNEEKERLQSELSERFEAEIAQQNTAADSENTQWIARFKRFDQERQYIRDAGLDQAEQTRQVEELLQQHFAPSEIEKAKAYRLPQG